VRKELTPLRAIRKHCIECSGNLVKNALWCQVTSCTLWRYRLGARPSTVREKHCPELVDPAAQPGPEMNVEDLPNGIPAAVAWFRARRETAEAGAPAA
jgi:hypothetical protein